MPIEGWQRYAEARPFVVPDRLGELAGPTAGVVELPTDLAWSGLRTYLKEALLRRAWPRLWLPVRIRRVWERRFPGLALAA